MSRHFLPRLLLAAAGLLLVADASVLLALRVVSLGVTLPLVLGCAWLALAWRWPAVQRWRAASAGRARLWRWGWIVFWAWLASLAAFFWVLQASAQGARPADGRVPAAAIVVLGSGTPGGRVSPVLAARLDLALARAQAQPGALVVASGGVGLGDAASEARVMADHLLARGLPAHRLLLEERSTSTEHNLLFSRPLLAGRGVAVATDPVDIVTSDFHTLRAGWIARRAGYAAARLHGAPMPLSVRYNAWLREYFAVASGWLLDEF